MTGIHRVPFDNKNKWSAKYYVPIEITYIDSGLLHAKPTGTQKICYVFSGTNITILVPGIFNNFSSEIIIVSISIQFSHF